MRTSNIFSEAVKVQTASIKLGETVCGSMPDEVDEETWYTVSCNDAITANTVRIEKAGNLVISEL